jgi:hypothetical protein
MFFVYLNMSLIPLLKPKCSLGFPNDLWGMARGGRRSLTGWNMETRSFPLRFNLVSFLRRQESFKYVPYNPQGDPETSSG